GLSAFYWLWRWRKGDAPRWMLWLVGLASPLGFLALEAGWIVTEAGRQPWIVYHVLRTRDAVTPRTDVGVTLVLYVVIYIALSVALVGLLRKLAHKEEAS
ncbi:MAG: cytochrome ubiquinol oxidase subunit I, partial [Polyangiales bacterium]